MLPVSSATHSPTGFVDALFTATSASCITGLTTVTTAEHWSLFGQIVIILLIQTGGLGITTLVTIIFMIMRKRITLSERLLLSESLNFDKKNTITGYVKYIVMFTFAVEALSAVILTFRFKADYGTAKSIYFGIFHSISAFCNAGFDVLGDNSLCDYSGDIVINITAIFLIIVSGLGFPVWSDLYTMLVNIFRKKHTLRHSIKRLNTHSKIAITTTAFLIVFGWVFFLICEWQNADTLGGFSIPRRLLAGLFQSVTLRTAGFASVPQQSLTDASKFVSVILMFIGGSPAGTAGGVKTVTIAVILYSVISVIRGNDSITVYKRSVPFETLQKALTIVSVMTACLFVAVIMLSRTEYALLASGKASFLDILYEVASALGTVGLTADVTGKLTVFGRIIICLCMFVGRIGPVTIAVSLTSGKSKTKNKIKYPDTNVMVG
jgi:trk system potassium uptake protein TrkH